MMDFLHSMPVMGWFVSALTLLTLMFVWWTKSNQAAWYDFLYCFPIPMIGHIGKLRRLKVNTEQVSARSSWVDGLPSPENTMCTEYSMALNQRAMSPVIFNRAKDYLRLSYQNNIRPMPGWVWALLFVLTIAEALGTGFLIAPWVSNEMSSSDMSYVGWVLAFVMAFVLLKMTHVAGKSARKIMSIKNGIGNIDKNGKPAGMDDDSPISPSMDQTVDAGQSSEARFYRRAVDGKDRGTWNAAIAAALLLVALLGAIFLERWEGIRKQNSVEVAQIEKNGVGEVSADSSNPFAAVTAGTLPPDVAENQKQSRKKMAEEIGSANLGQGFGAAILLSLIYLLTQAVGFFFAYEHSFIKDGEEAYTLTMGMPDYQSYHARYILPYEGRAEARLAELRRHFSSVLPDYGNRPATKMFREFVNEQQRQRSGMHEENIKAAATTTYQGASSPAAVAGMNYDTEVESAMKKFPASQDEAIAYWLKFNGVRNEADFMEAVARFNARKIPTSSAYTADVYDSAVLSIMNLPENAREAAMSKWLAGHGAAHENAIMDAVENFLSVKTAAPKLNSRMAAMLKGNHA